METLDYLKQCYQENKAPSLMLAIRTIEELQVQIEELTDILCSVLVQNAMIVYPYQDKKNVH